MKILFVLSVLFCFGQSLAAGQNDFCKKINSKWHSISLVMGDYGGDGHAETRETIICSNLTPTKFQAAYQQASKQLGFDFINEVATEYEDSSMFVSRVKKLREAGAEIVIEDEEYVSGGKVSLSQDEYLAIYLAIIKIGNAKFQYQKIEAKTQIDIGGYGLFSN